MTNKRYVGWVTCSVCGIQQFIEEEECKFDVPVCKFCGHRLDGSDTVEEEPWRWKTTK